MPSDHDHDGGLQVDLERLATWDRRTVLGWMTAAATVPMAACDGAIGVAKDASDDTATTDTDSLVGDDACSVISPETPGPYPGDGSNGPNALALAGIVRKDIRPDLTGGGRAEGVEMTMRFRLVDADGCTPLPGAAVYVWQCDKDSGYSMYTVASATYLRGVQVADADGVVEFTTIFPGCYPGRWPHLHFEVYGDLDATASATNVLATSQVALPEASCVAVYATPGYEDSIDNLSGVSLSTDGVFRDGAALQLATMTGTVDAGLTATLEVVVAA